jgi:CubicO group peptidase (beta-lactamase class C family)
LKLMNRNAPLLAVAMMFPVLLCCREQPEQQPSQTTEGTSSTQSVPSRIDAVENGLCSPVRIDGAEQVFHPLSQQMEFYNVPGVSIAVINNGEIEWAKGYGAREAGTSSPVDENTLFQAASISKSVSALGALHQVQRGVLDLDTNTGPAWAGPRWAPTPEEARFRPFFSCSRVDRRPPVFRFGSCPSLKQNSGTPVADI